MMNRALGCLAVAVWMMLSVSAWASCTGSGTSWSCPAGASVSDVQTAVSSATDGATITLSNGSYSWTGSGPVHLQNSKGVTIICATVHGCTIVSSGLIFDMPVWSGTITSLYRISGFNLVQNGAGQFTIWFCSGGGCSGTLTQVRVDNNDVTGATGSFLLVLGESKSLTNIYGVMDHNSFHAPGSIEILYMLGDTNPSPPVPSQGTGNNFFVEDNTVTVATMTNAGLGCMDGWSSTMRVVWRHNITTNCLVTAHGVTHAGGPDNVELYNNQMIVGPGAVSQGFADCYRCFHHQGSGMLVAFNNSFTGFSGKSGGALQLLHYRDYNGSIDGMLPYCDGTQSRDGNRSPVTTNHGYPCWHQPGRDTNGRYKPLYAWNNYWSDTLAQLTLTSPDGAYGNPDYQPQHVQEGREFYNAVSASAQNSPSSPFDGTIGMGFGSLANRPTSCMTNSTENGAGVGYFATDDGAQGTLYTCSATNTWTVYYTPYVYPHPLASGGTGTGDVQPPQNLQAIVN
jgi:hypothetical protein